MDQVYASRILNSLVTVFTLGLAFYLLRICGLGRSKSVAVVLLASTGHFWNYYRDLTTVDTYTTLGFFVAICGIYNYSQSKSLKWLLVTAVLSTSMGYGYSIVPLYAFWFLTRLVGHFSSSSPRHWMRWVKKEGSFLSLVCSLSLAELFVAHNIFAEALTRGVSLSDVGIVQSALRRLGIDPQFTEQYSLIWSKQLIQLRRIKSGLFPDFIDPYIARPVAYTLMIAGCYLLWRFLKNSTKEIKLVATLIAISGMLWLVPMRNFSWFHDYTAVNYIGFNLIVFAGLFAFIPEKWVAALIPVLIVFTTYTQFSYKKSKDEVASSFNRITEEFDAIAKKVPKGVPIYYPEDYRKITHGVEYTVGFYLPNNPISRKETEYMITTDRGMVDINLSPENKYYFLSKSSEHSSD